MKVVAAILAAGSGTRFGSDKTLALLGHKPVWKWSFDTFSSHARIDEVVVVCGSGNIEAIRSALPPTVVVVAGGATRNESSSIALQHCDSDVLVVHDGARPFVSADLINAVLDGVAAQGAAAPGVTLADTIRQADASGRRLIDRRSLFAMQTPQGARVDLLKQAQVAGPGDVTDEMALLDAMGVDWELVPGDPTNFKITAPEDLVRASAMLGSESRTGIGYDVHAFSTESGRPLMLGGVLFENHLALAGHSDADVVLHAVVDAILGAAALGDIGQHFPNSDPRWKNEPSITFLAHAAEVVGEQGWQVVNLDVTVIAESPPIMARAAEMRAVISGAARIELDRVSLKATTNERLGSIGRGEGIAAFAVSTLKR